MPKPQSPLFLGFAVGSLLAGIFSLIAALMVASPIIPFSYVAVLCVLITLISTVLAYRKKAPVSELNEATVPKSGESMAYIPELDGLRGIAVLMVFPSHFWWDYDAHLLDWGRLGVIHFFVLSGYLITTILLRNRDKSNETKEEKLGILKSFYFRRFIRIFPVYYFTVFLLLLVGYAPARENFLWLLTYTVNIGIGFFGVDVARALHFWSLAVEEQFYLVFPLFVLFLNRQQLKYLLYGGIAASILYKFFGNYLGIHHHGLIFSPFGGFDSLGLGALYALFRHQPIEYAKEQKRLILLAAFLGFPLLIGLQAWRYSLNNIVNNQALYTGFADLAISLCSIFVIQLLIQKKVPLLNHLFSFAPLRYIGKISYGAYVYHQFVIYLGFDLSIPLRFLLYSIISIGLAAASWHLFEAGLNRYKDYFPYLKLSKPASETQVKAG